MDLLKLKNKRADERTEAVFCPKRCVWSEVMPKLENKLSSQTRLHSVLGCLLFYMAQQDNVVGFNKATEIMKVHQK